MLRARSLPPLVVALAVLAANGAYLAGLSDPDPLGTRGGVAVRVVPGRLAGERTIDPNNGFVNQAIGRAVARDLLRGRIPQWDPNQAVGVPLLASPQSAALFPPTLLNALPNGLFLESLLLEVIAGLAALALARRLGLGEAAATAAGVLFALNGTFAWLQNGSMLPVAFIPLVLLGVERAVAATREQRRGGWGLLTVAIALLALSGWFETVYLSGFLVAGWCTWRLVELWPRRRALLGKLAAGGVCGVLLAAPQLLPFADSLRVSDLGGHAGELARATLPVDALPTMVGLPYAFGPIFGYEDAAQRIGGVWGRVGGYVAVTLLALALVGVLSRRLLGLRIVAGGWVLCCLVKSFGPQALVEVANHVPGMRSGAFYRYMTPSLTLALVLLAALGLDDLIARRARRRDVAVALGVTALLVWVGLLVASPITDGVPGAARALRWSLGWAGAATAMIGVAAALPARRWRSALLLAVVGVDAVAMFAVPTLSAPREVEVDAGVTRWIAAHVGVQRAYSFGPVSPNYGTYFDVPFAAVTNVPTLQLWSDLLIERFGPVDVVNFAFRGPEQEAVQRDPDFLRLLGVRYVVLTHDGPVPPGLVGALRLVHAERSGDVYELRGARPYFDAPGCETTARSRAEVVVVCDRSATLVRREQAFPGWTATVDRAPASVRLAQPLFQGVRVPAGESIVRFDYTAPWLWPSLLLALAGFAALAGGRFVAPWYLDRRRKLVTEDADRGGGSP